ncbi:MAG: ATP-dependent zinc metalloprotease FtsH [Defluviitaleaceae bacterium]|nr:ATP-dependent zinc metalloprotease FtsH [Defluviitaleaceae bacterium]
MFLAMILVFVVAQSSTNDQVITYSYSEFLQALHTGEITEVIITNDTEVYGAGSIRIRKTNGELRHVNISWMPALHQDLANAPFGHPLLISSTPPPRPNPLFQFITPMVIVIIVIAVIFFIRNQMQDGGASGGGNRVMNFGKSRARLTLESEKKVTFNDVAGLTEEKNDLEELVDFLKNPKKYTEIGARIPKGILLVGPPGTGKTLLAKAVAGEAGSPFFSISGSDFVEMFVGVGASRVRDLFENAKKNAPCIVFIDEIDAVGRKRGAGHGGGHDEREQTLNQLLVEMDGFGVNEGIIIIAATNRPDILDPALLRPGRFDRQVVVGRPDVKGRKEILEIHARGKKLAANVDLQIVAQTTSGFTGADLENLLNESALLSARVGKQRIDMEEIRKAFIKIGLGTEKKSRVISEKDRRMTAYHEAGHAILQEILEELDAVHIISIIPTGRAGGYMMPIPTEDKSYRSKKAMEQELIVLLGGRVAEQLIIGDITTGASNDIERVTTTARSMITKFGMSESLGPILFGEQEGEIFLGGGIGAGVRNYGEDVAGRIDEETKKIVTHAYEEAKRLLTAHMDVMHACAELLLEKEKITGEEFRKLFADGILPDKKKAEMFKESF